MGSNLIELFRRFPPVNKFLQVSRRWFHAGSNILTILLKDIQFKKHLDLLLARANMFSSLVFRVADFLINRRPFIAYDIRLEPENGLLQYSQRLPIHWYEFNEIPKLLELFSPEMNSPEPWDITDFYHRSRDALRDFEGMIHTRSIFPPFSSTAMLMGNKHIISFDGKVYDFNGVCKHLLVSDFSHQKFSITVQFENEKQKSFSINVDNKEIELFIDGKVSVDGKRIELPITINSSYVNRIGNRIKLHNSNGFLVDLNLVQNLCTVRLSGWYFGVTGGLFGVFDNEPSNDWMLPSHRISEDLQQFFDSWKIGDDCTATQTSMNISTLEWDQKKCYNLFMNKDSYLRPCFGTVDPMPFYEICLKEMDIVSTDFRKTISLSCLTHTKE